MFFQLVLCHIIQPKMAALFNFFYSSYFKHIFNILIIHAISIGFTADFMG